MLLPFCVVQAQKFDSLALVPPMGWNSWNKFGCNVNEKMIMEMADAMVSSGMRDVGYQYIVIDDCWQVGRDKDGNILPDPVNFPSGMKALADYIHSKGLKFGVYSDAGSKTCAGRPGSRGHEYQDARAYASWGVDYLKYDWCNTGTQNAEASYKTMRDALYAAGRPIVFSLCEWGTNQPWLWAKDVGHLWRTTGDISDCWDCEMNWGGLGWTKILDKQVGLSKYVGPGHWNDPDMMEVGNGGLTDTQNKSHFSLWCMLAAPLICGNDLRSMSPTVKEILTNKELIAIDQDSLGRQGFRWIVTEGIEVWAKPLANGELAICFFNRSNVSRSLHFDWKKWWLADVDAGFKGIEILPTFTIRDLWLHKAIGTCATPLQITLPAYDVLVVRLSR